MARILGVGIATLDIINTVDGFPEEDAEVRAISQDCRRGGNATNTLVVLSQLGHQVSWAGNLADDPNSKLIRHDLARYLVDISPVKVIPDSQVPTSYITLNQQNGSRTIVHYRNLDEFAFEDFQSLDLKQYDWLHFEGRNAVQTLQMLVFAQQNVPHIPRSVEIEKTRTNIRELCSYADLLLYSRPYVDGLVAEGLLEGQTITEDTPRLFLENMIQQYPTADHVCPWGKDGAYGINRSHEMIHLPAFKPDKVIDTLGAGDTFTAGLINGYLTGLDFSSAIQSANRLAGQKCGRKGFDGLSL